MELGEREIVQNELKGRGYDKELFFLSIFDFYFFVMELINFFIIIGIAT